MFEDSYITVHGKRNLIFFLFSSNILIQSYAVCSVGIAVLSVCQNCVLCQTVKHILEFFRTSEHIHDSFLKTKHYYEMLVSYLKRRPLMQTVYNIVEI